MELYANRKVVRQCDWLIGISIGFYILSRIATLVLFNMTATETGADIEAVQNIYEANPIFKATLQLKMIAYIINFLVIPATLFTVYFILRGKVLKNSFHSDTLQYHTLFLFFFTMLQLINDASSLLGRLL